jgi:hypothetical protein
MTKSAASANDANEWFAPSTPGKEKSGAAVPTAMPFE